MNAPSLSYSGIFLTSNTEQTVFKTFLHQPETQSLVEHAVLPSFDNINNLFNCKHCAGRSDTIVRVGECPNMVKEWGFCPVALKCRRCNAPVIKCVIEQVPELQMDEHLLARLTWIPIVVQLKNLRHRRDSEIHKESIRSVRDRFGQATIAWLSSPCEVRLDFITLFHEELQLIHIVDLADIVVNNRKAEISLRNMLSRFFLFLYRILVLGDDDEGVASRTTTRLNMWLDMAFTLCLNKEDTLTESHIKLYWHFCNIVQPIGDFELELASDLLQMFLICYLWQFHWCHRMAAQHRRMMTSRSPSPSRTPSPVAPVRQCGDDENDSIMFDLDAVVNSEDDDNDNNDNNRERSEASSPQDWYGH